MPVQSAKQLAKKILDRTLMPIVRYGLDPMVAKLAAQIEDAVVKFDEAGAGLLSRFEELGSRMVGQAVAQNEAYANSAAKEQLRRSQPLLRQEMAQLRARIAEQTPDNPCIHGFKVYAQADEDGIIESILSRLPAHSKTFIEIGCGNGLENNTHYLALKDYRGCWVDGSDDNIAFIKNWLGALEFENLLIKSSFVGTENMAALIADLCDFLRTKEPAFFSLDIDGNDFHVLGEALKCFHPLVICVEYNAKFPPPLKIAMRYDPSHRWRGDDYHGASLQSFCGLLGDYKLVSCNLTGVNAFFVRLDHAGAFAAYPPEQLYQPFRENLIDLWAEHMPSLKWLRDKLVSRE